MTREIGCPKRRAFTRVIVDGMSQEDRWSVEPPGIEPVGEASEEQVRLGGDVLRVYVVCIVGSLCFVSALASGCGNTFATSPSGIEPCSGVERATLLDFYDSVERARERGVSRELLEDSIVDGCYDQACQCARSVFDDVYSGRTLPPTELGIVDESDSSAGWDYEYNYTMSPLDMWNMQQLVNMRW